MDTQPGQVYTPNDGNSTQSGQPLPPTSTLPTPVQQSTPTPTPVVQQTPSPAVQTPAPFTYEQTTPAVAPTDGGWQYDERTAIGDSAEPLPNDVEWVAAEFVEHTKGAGWYGALIVITVALSVAYYFISRDWVFTTVIVLAGLAFGVYAARKPRTQHYKLNPQGVQVGERIYSFGNFRNFSIAEDGAITSVVFMPLARFAPTLTIYVTQEVEGQVMDYLSLFLPFEQHRSDAIDALLRRIHF